MRTGRWFSVWLSMWIWLPGYLQGQVYTVTRYSTDVGLPQSQAMTMLQDHLGYLWIGTHRGLTRFDGRTFQSYNTRKDSLAGNFLTDLVETPEGDLWIATDNGISRFDGQHFVTYLREDGLEDHDVRCLMYDRIGRLWIGGRSGGLSLWQDDSFIHSPFGNSDELTGPTIEAMLEDRQGRVWVATPRGLFVKDRADQIRQLLLEDGRRPEPEVRCLLEDQVGTIWVGTPQGVYKYDGATVMHDALRQRDLPDNRISCMVQDPKGQVWLGTENGIIRFDGEQYIPLIRKDRILDYDMRSAVVDDEGNIWFGTDGGGLRKITEGVFVSYGMKDGLSSNLAKAFLQDRRGNIWISTKDRGINVFDGKDIIRQYRYGKTYGLGGDAICYSFADSRGHFWFASYNGTLTQYNGFRFKTYDADDGLNCTAAYTVYEDSSQRLWIGTDAGLYLMEKGRITAHFGEEEGLASLNVYALMQDRNGLLWIGTSEGLYHLDKESITRVEAGDNVGANVLALVEDAEGRVWVGSAIGLAYFEGEESNWIRISGVDGAHTIVGLALEGTEKLWIATENGAYRLTLRDLSISNKRARFEHFTQKDGLPSLECNANAMLVDNEGDIWIGTAEGAIHKPTGTVRPPKDSPPPIYITRVSTASDKSWSEQGYSLDEWGLPLNLKLPSELNTVEFSFIAISLKSPQQVEYRYRLKGLDDGWQNPSHNTQIRIPNLEPGTYTFMVTAKKEAEQWDYSHSASFDFEILPPIYATWWFRSAAAAVFLLFAWLVYRFLTLRRRRQREAQHMQDTAEKLQLEHQALYAMMNPHFTFNALQSIQYFILRQDKKKA
ncbi:MAG: two-component regulator propeller domain-containing protein, partial [Bacteroidota bacterium]